MKLKILIILLLFLLIHSQMKNPSSSPIGRKKFSNYVRPEYGKLILVF